MLLDSCASSQPICRTDKLSCGLTNCQSASLGLQARRPCNRLSINNFALDHTEKVAKKLL